MVIQGKERGDILQAGDYLVDKKDNEEVRFIGTKGTVSNDAQGAVREMEAIAALSRAKEPLYHASINPEKDEFLTEEQWERAVDLLEENLGFVGHQRAVSEHTKKDGSVHRHIIWNRINPETFIAANIWKNYLTHERTARQLENEFGLKKTRGAFFDEPDHIKEYDSKNKGIESSKIKESKRTGVDLYQWRRDVKKLAAQAEGKTGAELVALLESHGHMVAKGDRIAFVMLDPSGTPQRMAQSLGMKKVKHLKERLSDVDRDSLPDAREAQEKQKAFFAQREQGDKERDSAGTATPEPQKQRVKKTWDELTPAEKKDWLWKKELGHALEDAKNVPDALVPVVLEHRGFMLARDDEQLMIVGRQGKPAPVNWTTAGRNNAIALQQRLTGVADLPTVEEARGKFGEHYRAQRLNQRIKQSDWEKRAQDSLQAWEQRQKEWAEKQKKSELAEKKKARREAGMYSHGSMASQQNDALRHIKDKHKLRQKQKQLSPQHPDGKEVAERVKKDKEKESARAAKAITQPTQAKRPTQSQARRSEHRARTEQTDSKQRQSTRDIMREYSDRFGATNEDLQHLTHDRGGGRERGR